jgi:small GTP-binding protein
MFDHHAQLKAKALDHLRKSSELARTLNLNLIADQIELGRRRLEDCRYNIAIMGDIKRGKSTLLNTLLGRRDDFLSPVQAKVCTSGIIHYLSKEAHPDGKSEARVFLEGMPDSPQVIGIEELRLYITEDGNPGNSKGVRSVDVYGDFPLLRNVVTLVDTPGRGAVHRHHETLVEQFLPMADAIIFLISADLPVTASEAEFLAELSRREKDKLIFVLTKKDEVNEKDLPEVRSYVKQQIRDAGLTCSKLFEVSAKSVFEALCLDEDEERINELRRTSGIAEFEAHLEQFILKNSERTADLLPRLRDLLAIVDRIFVEDLRRIESEKTLVSSGIAEIEAEQNHLTQESDELSKAAEASLRKFQTAWNNTIRVFQSRLQSRSSSVADRILEKIQRGSTLSVISASFKMKQLVQRSLSNELEAILPELEQKLTEHVTRLSEDLERDWVSCRRTKLPFEIALPTASLVGLGGSALALGSVFTQASAAMAAWGTAAELTTVAGGSWGLGPTIASWLGFGGKIAAGKAGTAAVATAIGATVPVVVAAATFLGVVWIAKHAAKATQENRVPALVEETLARMAESIGEQLTKQGHALAATYRESVQEQVNAIKDRLATLREAAEKDDPDFTARLATQEKTIRHLLERNREITLGANLLTTSA